jgi:hypothetical protein
VVVEKKAFIPGPGSYDPKDYMDSNYVLSQWKNASTRRFGTAARMQLKMTKDTPGPGTYRPPSDFGYVDSMKSPRT